MYGLRVFLSFSPVELLTFRNLLQNVCTFHIGMIHEHLFQYLSIIQHFDARTNVADSMLIRLASA
jgi:uncharacterized protein YktB (UPF0637 family)